MRLMIELPESASQFVFDDCQHGQWLDFVALAEHLWYNNEDIIGVQIVDNDE